MEELADFIPAAFTPELGALDSSRLMSARPAVKAVITSGWLIEAHWEIENRLHWVRDVAFDEDHSQIRTGNAPSIMAALRNTVITLLRLAGHHNIAAALRHHANDTGRPITLLLTA
ncbi:hypothetical protein SSP531S_05660 [Streptomyces spongiicola]|uniref:ISAs1 family transposase n=1 Tax=Streptomyces spongiicola TaxID=1690221 RepID=A0A388STL0_9ACTN|nr:hypothetical protein SSP531S_05660 [Streptomyces spongiicola]